MLFERYPRLAGNPVDRARKFPVPVQRMEKLGKEIGANELWVLRED